MSKRILTLPGLVLGLALGLTGLVAAQNNPPAQPRAPQGNRAMKVGVVDIGALFREYKRKDTLEQQVNAADLPEDVKIKLQGYVSGCYGTLTSFNVLFADEGDQFKGSGE